MRYRSRALLMWVASKTLAFRSFHAKIVWRINKLFWVLYGTTFVNWHLTRKSMSYIAMDLVT